MVVFVLATALLLLAHSTRAAFHDVVTVEFIRELVTNGTTSRFITRYIKLTAKETITVELTPSSNILYFDHCSFSLSKGKSNVIAVYPRLLDAIDISTLDMGQADFESFVNDQSRREWWQQISSGSFVSTNVMISAAFRIGDYVQVYEETFSLTQRYQYTGLCLSWGDPHVKPFASDSSTNLPQLLSGPVTLLRAPFLTVQMDTEVCPDLSNDATCATAIGIQYKSNWIYFNAVDNTRKTIIPDPTEVILLANEQGFVVSLPKISVNILVQRDTFWSEVKVFQIINVAITLPGAFQGETSGLCGYFNSTSISLVQRHPSYMVYSDCNILENNKPQCVRYEFPLDKLCGVDGMDSTTTSSILPTISIISPSSTSTVSTVNDASDTATSTSIQTAATETSTMATSTPTINSTSCPYGYCGTTISTIMFQPIPFNESSQNNSDSGSLPKLLPDQARAVCETYLGSIWCPFIDNRRSFIEDCALDMFMMPSYSVLNSAFQMLSTVCSQNQGPGNEDDGSNPNMLNCPSGIAQNCCFHGGTLASTVTGMKYCKCPYPYGGSDCASDLEDILNNIRVVAAQIRSIPNDPNAASISSFSFVVGIMTILINL